jgi:hypothetical protein
LAWSALWSPSASQVLQHMCASVYAHVCRVGKESICISLSLWSLSPDCSSSGPHPTSVWLTHQVLRLCGHEYIQIHLHLGVICARLLSRVVYCEESKF